MTKQLTDPQRRALNLMLEEYRLCETLEGLHTDLVRGWYVEHTIKIHYMTGEALINKGFVRFVEERDFEGICDDFYYVINEKGKHALTDAAGKVEDTLVLCDLCDEPIKGKPHIDEDDTLCDECHAQLLEEGDEIMEEQRQAYSRMVMEGLERYR